MGNITINVGAAKALKKKKTKRGVARKRTLKMSREPPTPVHRNALMPHQPNQFFPNPNIPQYEMGQHRGQLAQVVKPQILRIEEIPSTKRAERDRNSESEIKLNKEWSDFKKESAAEKEQFHDEHKNLIVGILKKQQVGSEIKKMNPKAMKALFGTQPNATSLLHTSADDVVNEPESFGNKGLVRAPTTATKSEHTQAWADITEMATPTKLPKSSSTPQSKVAMRNSAETDHHDIDKDMDSMKGAPRGVRNLGFPDQYVSSELIRATNQERALKRDEIRARIHKENATEAARRAHPVIDSSPITFSLGSQPHPPSEPRRADGLELFGGNT